MVKTISLQSGALPLPLEWLEQMGLSENDSVIAELSNGVVLIRPLSEAEKAAERLRAHLRLPVGALAHRAVNPDEPATLESELISCEDIYADID